MRTGSCTKITNYWSGFFFFMNSPPGALCRYLCLCRAQSLSGDSSPWGPTINERAACLCCNGPFRIQPSQLPGQSTACLFVCACSLFSLLFYPFLFLPVALCKDFPPPSFLYLSVVCPIDLFASAPLMVPSFGSFVNTLDIIAILCETKKRWN